MRFYGRGGTSESDVGERAVEKPKVEKAKSDEDDGPDDSANARRLARMLVSEIKVGNEKRVLEGRVNSDLYSRLQKEIDASRETYRRQVDAPGGDYFHEELIKILADNDPERLGKDYPGPSGP